MEERRKYKKVRKRGETGDLRTNLRYLLLIASFCLILAFGVVFITGKMPSFLERAIQRQADRFASEKLDDVKKEMIQKSKEESVEDIIRKYKDKSNQ